GRLGRPVQLRLGGERTTGSSRRRNGCRSSTRLVAGAGKTDADLMAAEYAVFAFRRRVLLVEDLALPAAVGRGIGAEVIEESIAAEDAAVQQQHDTRQAGLNAVECANLDGIEPIDNAALPDGADRRQRLVVEPRQFSPEQGAGPRR